MDNIPIDELSDSAPHTFNGAISTMALPGSGSDRDVLTDIQDTEASDENYRSPSFRFSSRGESGKLSRRASKLIGKTGKSESNFVAMKSAISATPMYLEKPRIIPTVPRYISGEPAWEELKRDQ